MAGDPICHMRGVHYSPDYMCEPVARGKAMAETLKQMYDLHRRIAELEADRDVAFRCAEANGERARLGDDMLDASREKVAALEAELQDWKDGPELRRGLGILEEERQSWEDALGEQIELLNATADERDALRERAMKLDRVVAAARVDGSPRNPDLWQALAALDGEGEG